MEAWGKTVLAGAGALFGGPVGWAVAGGVIGDAVGKLIADDEDTGETVLYNYFLCMGTVLGDDNYEVSEASMQCFRELVDEWELDEEGSEIALEAFITGVEDEEFSEDDWARNFVQQAEESGLQDPEICLVTDCLRMAFADPLNLAGKKFTVGEIAEAVGIPRSDVDDAFARFEQDRPTEKELAAFFSCLGKLAIADGEVSDQEIDQLGDCSRVSMASTTKKEFA